MSRIDRARYDAARFPFAVEIPTRFADLDVQGHVNNAAAVVLLQEGRVAFNREAGLGRSLAGLGTVVAALAIDYAGELHHPAPVTVHVAALAVGRTSVTLAQRIDQGGAPKLYAEVVMVVVGTDGATPVPDVLRDALGRLAIG